MMNINLHLWSYTIIFGFLSAAIIGYNIFLLLNSIYRKESTSFTLFIGAIFGSISLLVAPEPGLKWFSMVPFIIDPGAGFVIYQIVKTMKSKNKN